MDKTQFLRTYLPYARSVSEQTGIAPEVVLAQTALETGWGKSAPSGNFFGIKGSGQTLPTQEFRNGQMVTENAGFRSYASPADSFTDYAKLMMNNKRYAPVLGAQGADAQIEALGKSGYATDPNYAAKLSQIKNSINLNSPDLIGSDTMRALGVSPGAIGPMTGSNQPQRTGAPMGLLDTQPAQQPEQKKSGFWDNFAGGLLADPDRRAKIGIALEGMTLNPNQGLIKNLQSGIDTRKEQASSNRTIEWLRSQGRDDLADAVASGSLDGKTAAATLFNKDATEGVVIDNRLIDKRTGKVIYEPTGGPAFDVEKVQSARKEFTGLPQVKAFADQTTAYGTLISSVADPSPAGDLSLIFNYMKILDPGSTVREGEFATAQDSGSIDDRTRGLYNRIVNGERLSERQRSDFADRATRIYSSAEQQYNSFAEQYGRFAQAAGLPTEQVIPDYSFVGNRYQTPLIYQLPSPPQGVTQQDWTDAWNNMTDAQRQTFLNNPTTP